MESYSESLSKSFSESLSESYFETEEILNSILNKNLQHFIPAGNLIMPVDTVQMEENQSFTRFFVPYEFS